jgi:AraC-like DNA-binding protein
MGSENVINMPSYSFFANESAPECAQRLFEIFYQTAADISYRSRGEDRRDEEHCIFHYTLSGSGEVIYNGERHTVAAGQGFFNVINMESCGYGYPEGGKEPWKFIVLCFRGAGVREAVLFFCQKRAVYDVPLDSVIDVCNEALIGERGRLTAFSRLISLICEGQGEACALVSDFRAYVKAHASENPTVMSVARHLGVTREHLSRVYLEKTGQTPASFIKAKRYELVCDLIARGVSFEKIACQLRFPSVQGMSLFFKKMSGISPSEYKKKGYLRV